ncbi:hypothetical protein BGW41_004276 [Actinomortierella wolfii]|nr:hypothetical protein BGW41_004276 [Actinomortierella wolfii]
MTRKKNQKRREAAKAKKAASRSNSDASMDMAISPSESTATEHTAIVSTERSSADEAIVPTIQVNPDVSPDSGSQADEESDGSDADEHDGDVNDDSEAHHPSSTDDVKVIDKISDDTLVSSSQNEPVEGNPVGSFKEGDNVEIENDNDHSKETAGMEDEASAISFKDSVEDHVESKEWLAVDTPVIEETVPLTSETVTVEPVTKGVDEIPVDDEVVHQEDEAKGPETTPAENITVTPITTEEPQVTDITSDSSIIPHMNIEADGLPSSDHQVWASEAPAMEESMPTKEESSAESECKEASEPAVDKSDNVDQEQPATNEPIQANYISEGRVISNESISNLPSMDVASDTVATVAIQCLERDKDMELSYVAILSAITVLKQRRDDSTPISVDQMHSISAKYSHLIQLCTQDSMRLGLEEETMRQGVLTTESLYFQLYQSILEAGFQLEDKDHLAISVVFLHYKRADKALQAMEHIPKDHWKGAEYRHAIQCHMACKPRRQADVDDLLAEYQRKEGQSMKAIIQEWYRLCQQSAKWEEIKAQYERRRARLVDGPNNVERISNAGSVPSTSIDLGTSPLGSPRASRHERTSSTGSTSTTISSPGHQRSTSASSHQRTPSVNATSWPSGAPAALNTPVPAAPTTKGAFSFLSNFKFPGTGSKSPQDQQPTLPSSVHANHHLTVLDNNMLEECVKFKEFEYGWKRIYERMGPQLEDKDTAKIVMRLCKRAFLGYGGAGPEAPGSPNVQSKDMFDQDGEAASRIAEAILQIAPGDRSLFAQDPEIWEARAWAVYNKAMMNPQALGASIAPSHLHHHNPHHTVAQGLGVQGAATTSIDLSQPISSLNSHTSMSVFLHDILTISTCSPEESSRYLKAYRVYSTIRSDPTTQLQLRDPFVMKVVLKAIYDSVLSIVRAQERGIDLEPSTLVDRAASPDLPRSAKIHRRRLSTLSLGRVQTMSIGPLMDLAFEIYSDLRDTGSIRQLSWLNPPSGSGVTPTTPAVRTPQGNLALFFNPSSSSTRSESGLSNEADTSTATSDTVDLSNTSAIPTASTSPRASLSGASTPVFQELSPLLVPSPHARILPNEIYLALLHLCIQVPVWEISSKVVHTIVADMKLGMSKEGDDKFSVDGEIAAALQCYHDTWMCATAPESTENEKRCKFQALMYREAEDQEVVDHTSPSSKAPSCDEHGYWNLWSKQDSRLTRLLYSPSRASELIEHIEQALVAPVANA